MSASRQKRHGLIANATDGADRFAEDSFDEQDRERVSIQFKATATQRRFIQSRAEAVLWSARMGDGKSAAICWAVFKHARENPGAKALIVRDTWESLRATTFSEFAKWFPLGVVGDYKASEKLFKWTVGEMRGEITFIGLDQPSDASKLQSREIAALYVDEAAPAAESGGVDEFIFDTAMTRLRQPGMQYYDAKIAQNSSDESHWTYRKFVDPGTPGYQYITSQTAENAVNLPKGYYDRMRKTYAHRPDLIARFAEGRFGFVPLGRAVTPEWSDDVHLARSLEPERGRGLTLLWDWGLTPVCLVTQVTSMGTWNILDAIVGEDMGAYELAVHLVKPRLAQRYTDMPIDHIGDPAGTSRAQAFSELTPVRVVKRELGGRFRPGPFSIAERIDPLRWCMTQMRNGKGLIQVDADHAKPVQTALRGGWHYHVARTGVVSGQPTKNHPDSDIGDAMGYGAAILFPSGQLSKKRKRFSEFLGTNHFRRNGLGFEKPGLDAPNHGDTLDLKDAK